MSESAADVRQRLRSILGGSVGNLVEWYDFYVHSAFSTYFAPSFFPDADPVATQLGSAGAFVSACIFGSLLVYLRMPDTRTHGTMRSR